MAALVGLSLFARAAAADAAPGFVAPLDTPRDRLFNEGWLFHRGDAPGAEAADFADSAWRKVSLPHDWSIEPIPAGDDPAKQAVFNPLPGEWRYREGDSDDYAAVAFHDSAWKTLALPALIPNAKPATYYWFRREMTLPPGQAGTDLLLELGLIDDCDELYVNGEKVGDTGVMPKNQPQGNCIPAFTKNRIYRVPARQVNPGKNLVALCVYNNKGPCGFLPASEQAGRQAKGEARAETVGPFSSLAVGGTHSGFTVGGTGWYRKHFRVDAADAGKAFEILFGAVSMNSDVWFNGRHLGEHPYGYTSFYYDLTPHLKPGEENVLAVRVRNEGVTSRWYPGSGIYRNVWLTRTGPTHLRRWGVQIQTPEASAQSAKVLLNVEVEGEVAGCALRVELLDAQGTAAAAGAAEVGGEVTPLTLTVKNPQLWDLEAPHLYRANVQLTRAGRVIDEVSEPFGIRTLAYTVDKGFQLNGKTIDMWGGCVHHDNGLLGAAAFDRAEFRKVEILKANGYNAVRAAHNPMSDAFYAACDRLGLLVMDEVFDVWHVHKTPQDYGGDVFEKWCERDMELWLRRTRNHPSIVIRSLGNEIGNREKDAQALTDILLRLKAQVAKHDPTRPTTGGNASAYDRHDYLSHYDVKGYNYREDKIEQNHALFPDWVSISTESVPSGKGSRDEPGQLATWNFVGDRPWHTGSFVWSAFEYIGESWSGWVGLDGEEADWPSYAAACGLIDITGYVKGGQLYRNVINGASKIEILVLEPPPAGRKRMYKPWSWPLEYPCWGWDGFEGQTVEVKVVTRAPEVRLRLNGREVGRGTTDKGRISNVFKIPYEPGELVAEGLENGSVRFTKTLKTPGKPVGFRVASDRSPITTSRGDLAFVTVEVVDAKGQLVQTGRYNVSYQVSGAGALEACGNGFHKDVYSFRNPGKGTTYHGRSQVILRPTGKAGEITLTVESTDFPAATLKVPVAP